MVVWQAGKCWLANASSNKRPVHIFAFGEYKSKQLNVSGIQHYLVQI